MVMLVEFARALVEQILSVERGEECEKPKKQSAPHGSAEFGGMGEAAAGGYDFIESTRGIGGVEGFDGVSDDCDAPSGFQDAASRIENADFRDHAINHAVIRREQIQGAREIARGEDIDILLFDHDLLGTGDFDGALAVRNHHSPIEQRGFRLALPVCAGHAMVRPDPELGIGLGVGIHRRYNRDPVGCGVPVETRDVRYHTLSSRYVKRTGRKKKIKLGIDVNEDGGHLAGSIVSQG